MKFDESKKFYDIGIDEIVCTDRYYSTDGLSIRYDAQAVNRPDKCNCPGYGFKD